MIRRLEREYDRLVGDQKQGDIVSVASRYGTPAQN